MNIFYLNSDPKVAAREVCAVHVRKMIVESTQMLSTAHHILDCNNPTSAHLVGNPPPSDWYLTVLMKPSHANHPSNIWVRQNRNHYKWLAQYTLELLAIYKNLTGKTHKCELERSDIYTTLPINLPSGMFTPPPMCMPDEYKHKYSVVRAYRQYLTAKYNEWLSRARPVKVDFPYGQPDWLTLTHS